MGSKKSKAPAPYVPPPPPPPPAPQTPAALEPASIKQDAVDGGTTAASGKRSLRIDLGGMGGGTGLKIG